MKHFPEGVRLNENEAEYQASLQEYQDGLVLNISRDRNGRYTVHRAVCQTLSYDLARKGQSHRPPKVLCHDGQELLRAAASQGIHPDHINRCGRCKPSHPH